MYICIYLHRMACLQRNLALNMTWSARAACVAVRRHAVRDLCHGHVKCDVLTVWAVSSRNFYIYHRVHLNRCMRRGMSRLSLTHMVACMHFDTRLVIHVTCSG